MKPGDLVCGDLVRINLPGSAYPQDNHLHGMLVIILNEPYKTSAYHTYIKCLCDGIRMIPTRWLEVLQ